MSSLLPKKIRTVADSVNRKNRGTVDPTSNVGARTKAGDAAFRHVVHAATLRLLLDEVLRLALRADEDDLLAGLGELPQEITRPHQPFNRLANIDDMNLISLAEDVLAHPGMPTADTVPEVNARSNQILDLNYGQQLTPCTPA